jgi:hypothetical protein
MLMALVIKNQTNLDRMRARLRQLRDMKKHIALDTERQLGAYAEYWEQYQELLAADEVEFRADILVIKNFVDQLHEYIAAAKSSTKNQSESDCSMIDLSEEMLQCEQDMIQQMDRSLQTAREYAVHIQAVEASDWMWE